MQAGATVKVLFITLGLPSRPRAGAQIRDFELMRRIAERHEVRLVALTEAAPEQRQIEEVERVLGPVRALVVPSALKSDLLYRLPSHLRARWPVATLPFVHRTALATIGRIAREWGPDIVQVEHSFLAPYVEALDRTGCATVLSLHNIGEVQYRRMHRMARGVTGKAGALLKSLAMRGWEASWAGRFDRVLAVSDADRQHLLGRDASLRVRVVPNGVDTHKRQLLPSAEGSHDLLFAANMAYPPNAEALVYFIDRVFPLVRRQFRGATFTAVGMGITPEMRAVGARDGIIIAGPVNKIEPFYRQAAICVVPLLAGSGTRLKILEAMALGRPVVSTTVGCEGLDVRAGRHLAIADEPAALADAIVRLLRDPARARQMAWQARALVESRYDWNGIAEALDAIYSEIRGGGRCANPSS